MLAAAWGGVAAAVLLVKADLSNRAIGQRNRQGLAENRQRGECGSDGCDLLHQARQ
jgi:hypothetical protein